MKDTLILIKDSTVTSLNTSVLNKLQDDKSHLNWWSIISILELTIIIVLLFKLKRKERFDNKFDKYQELKNAKKSNIDMNDLMNSINYSKDLYKELSRKCHPDRFENEDLKMKAEQIFQEITRHKHNHKILLELKEKAIKELSITFKNN